MAQTFQITFGPGFVKTHSALRALSAFTSDFSPIMRGVGELMKNQVQRTFRAQRDPETGAPWPRTGSLTLRTRVGGGAGGKTLVDSGRLMNSIVSAAPRVTKDSVAIGTNLPGAAIHQNGGTIRPRNAKALSIPMTRQARRAGSVARLMAQRPKARVFRGIVAETGPNKKLIVHFVFKKQVKIPRRRYLGVGPEYRRELAAFVADRAMAEVRRHMGS